MILSIPPETTDQPETTNQPATTNPPVTEEPEEEDPNFCQGKKNGLYSHPDCAKYYECYNKV